MSYVLSVLSETDIGKSDGGAARRIGCAEGFAGGYESPMGGRIGRSGMNSDVLSEYRFYRHRNFDIVYAARILFIKSLGSSHKSTSGMELERTNSLLHRSSLKKGGSASSTSPQFRPPVSPSSLPHRGQLASRHSPSVLPSISRHRLAKSEICSSPLSRLSPCNASSN